MTEHKWAHILRAMADGKEAQYRSVVCTSWRKGNGNINPITDTGYEWRIKPTEQEKPMPTPHPHAASMLLYAQDAAIDGEAWRNWEYRNQEGAWRPLQDSPIWHPDCEYRRKPPAPKMLKVTTHSGKVLEFPEPLRVAPADGTEVFISHTSGTVANFLWDDCCAYLDLLSWPVVHLTREAAEKHAAALLAVNRGE